MLVKRAETIVLKTRLVVPKALADRLSRVKKLAESCGFSIDLEGALVADLERQVVRAEKALQGAGEERRS